MSTNRISNSLSNLKGDLLIASERLATTPLAKTVVLMLQHESSGSFGVVLNRPANADLRSAWQKASGTSGDVVGHLLQGGPMSGPVFALHPFETLGELCVDGDIYLSATSDSIEELVDGQREPYRICLGVMGWQPGTVERELEQGNWYRTAGNSELVFDNSGFLWEKSILRYGRGLLCDMLSLSDLPPNPERN